MNWKQKLLEKKHERTLLVKEAGEHLGAGKMDEYEAAREKIKALNTEIDAIEEQIAEEERFGGEPPAGKGMKPGKDEEEPDGYQKAVKALAAAARSGFPRQKAEAGTTMTEGTPADGGYTVPEDIVNRIIRFRESKESLLKLVRVEKVTTRSGKRTFKKRGQHKGFATVTEAAKYGAAATPEFSQLEYDIEKRGGYLPVTVELLEDSDENIAALVEEWLGDEARVTANKEIMAVIGTKPYTDLKNLDGILAAWVGLGSTFRATSSLITNDNGLLWLGTLKDTNGRYLLTPNPADPKQLRLCVGPYTLPVRTFDNDTIPNDETKIPMILGDLKEGVVYWDRRQFTLKVSDVAMVGELNAYEQDLMIWRGSLRDDCTAWDDEAFVNGYIDTASVPGG